MPQSCLTLWTIARQAPLSMGFSRQESWSGLPCPSPGDLANSGIRPRSPTLQAEPSLSEPPEKPIHIDQIRSVTQFVSDSLRPHELQNARPPCPSPTPRVHPNPCPLMPSSHLILCRPFLLLPPVPPSIRVFSNKSTLHMMWPKYWSFSLASFLPKKSQG